MEDLYFNQRAEFTRWVVRMQMLHEPLVLVDVGVFGGESTRWQVLGDFLVVHGFDAIETEVERLTKREAGNPGRHYHWMAIGNEDGEREFHMNVAQPDVELHLCARGRPLLPVWRHGGNPHTRADSASRYAIGRRHYPLRGLFKGRCRGIRKRCLYGC